MKPTKVVSVLVSILFGAAFCRAKPSLRGSSTTAKGRCLLSHLVPITDPPILPPGFLDHWVQPRSTTTWRTEKRRILYNDQRVILRGINFNGVESECRVNHGLWKHPLSFYLDLLREHRFNAVRVPLSFEVMRDLTQPIDSRCLSAEALAEIHGVQTVKEYLDLFLDMAWERGIVTLFDLHTIGGVITEYPWTNTVHEKDVLLAWANFAEHFAGHPGILGFEVKNEPHGTITMEEFDEHCARVIWQVKQQVGDRFQGLWFIGGIQVADDPWGGTIGDIGRMGPTTLENITHPSILCTLNVTDRIVFSPHVYGPDVRGPQVSSEGWDVMERRFGYLYNASNHWNQSVILATEIGGFLRPDDLRYYEGWRSYIQKYGMDQGSFWWTLPETSKDTGGLVMGADWSVVDPVKMKFIESLHPNPTDFLAMTSTNGRHVSKKIVTM